MKQHSIPRGSIMLLAIATILILSSLLLVFVREMRIEAQAAANRAATLQAAGIARGAIAYCINHLTSNQDPIALDTEMQCEANPVGDGYFWILKPDVTDETKYAFGLTDEASKLNLNTATYEMLKAMPNMSTDLSGSITDWRDSDDSVSNQGGAESEYYLLLAEPYYCKNAPFETPEEILLVKGATTDLLYGVDANHNGVVDASEDDAKSTLSISGFNGNARCGIMKYLTVYSREVNTDANGKPRTNIAQASSTQITQLFSKIASPARLTAIQLRARANRGYRSVFEFYYKLGLTPDEFKKVVDKITVNPEKIIQGLVNINTAPKEVLQCLPGMAEGDGDALIARRTSSGTDLTNVAWVLDTLSAPKALTISNYITAKSKRFSADIVAVSGDGRGFKRMRCVFDASGTVPKVLYCKDMSHLGWPLDPGILEDLRAGKAVTPGTQTSPLQQNSQKSNTSGSSSSSSFGGSR
ncbi:MAG: type II secretion system protein GspK [Planctomycetota bacterium]